MDIYKPFEFMRFHCPVCQKEVETEEVPNNGFAEHCPIEGDSHLWYVPSTIVVYHEYGIIKQDVITYARPTNDSQRGGITAWSDRLGG